MRNGLFYGAIFVSLVVASPALADVPPPDSSGCLMKAAGDPCQKDNGSNGTCTTSTCTKLDYSDGSPPGTIEYECLLCTGSGGEGGSSSSNSSSSGGNSEDDGGCSVRSGGVAGAVGAWIFGAIVLVLARRTRTRARKQSRL